jgi:hypothetical protein
MTSTPATWATARWHDCPDGHADPRTGRLARMIVPDRSGLEPHCTACRQPMTPAGDPLAAQWRLDECCFPSGPDSTWAGPPRDPAACSTCYGTRARTVCLACYAANCDGDHLGACLACDGSKTQACEACDGEGRALDPSDDESGDESGDDTTPCPAPGCTAGQVPCEACGGTGREHSA